MWSVDSKKLYVIVLQTFLYPKRLSRQLRISVVKMGVDTTKFRKWWLRLDSNQRPLPCQGSALPTELRYHPINLRRYV